MSTLQAGATVNEILAWAGSARSRWRTVSATGYTGTEGNKTPFQLDVGETAWQLHTPSHDEGAGVAFPEGHVPSELSRPTSESHLRINDRLGDMLDPSTWLLKELLSKAGEVHNLGLVAVHGREALHLQAVFPLGLGNGEAWDVYVDRATGVIVKLVIYAGEEPYHRVIETLEIDLDFPLGYFGQGYQGGGPPNE